MSCSVPASKVCIKNGKFSWARTYYFNCMRRSLGINVSCEQRKKVVCPIDSHQQYLHYLFIFIFLKKKKLISEEVDSIRKIYFIILIVPLFIYKGKLNFHKLLIH
jgi:hypothetical protein